MPNLLICMTPGVGLNTWEKIGSLKRELKPYEEYIRRGWKVKILTFDKGRIPALPKGIEAVRFPDRKLLWLLPLTQKKLGTWADIIKTNQSVHAYFYTMAAKYWDKPILLRCGYVHGEFLEATGGFLPKIRLYQFLEKTAFQASSHSEVPTEDLFQWVTNKYHLPNNKLSVVPNFVDTGIFKPLPDISKTNNSIVSVGRLTKVKNYDQLIKACTAIPGSSLTIIGEGPERQNLLQIAQDNNVNLKLPGNLPQEALPGLIQEHTVFASASSWEGHPKALIEAMACGMPCLGVEASGTRGVINHRENGFLVKSLLPSLAEGLKELFQDPDLRNKLSQAARKYVESRFSFDECFSREYNIVQKLL